MSPHKLETAQPFPSVNLLPLDPEVVELVTDGIKEAEAAAPEAQGEAELQVLRFVEEIEQKEELLGRYSTWFRAASGRHPEVPGIAQCIESMLERPETEAAEPQDAVPEALSTIDIIDRFETQGYVTHTPRLSEMLKDTDRTQAFHYDRQNPGDKPRDRGMKIEVATEGEGLHELADFLGNYIARADGLRRAQRNRLFVNEAVQAKSIRDNLTFIGKKEFKEATAGLAAVWKNYLDGDPSRQICLITEAGNLPRYAQGMADVIKSDSYVANAIKKILLREDPAYAERFVDKPAELTASVDSVRVILVDDWTYAGGQLYDIASKLLKDPAMKRYRNALEINLLAAPKERIEGGFGITFRGREQPIPVHAYYQAFQAPHSGEEALCHITGTHSTVNKGFGFTLHRLKMNLNDTKSFGQTPYRLPALASVYRAYWKMAAAQKQAQK